MRIPAMTLCGIVMLAAANAWSAEPALDAQLADPAVYAKKMGALVVVTVTDIELIDADETGPAPKPGQGHLHYRLDDGPVIATSARKLGFHELAPGAHKIRVVLVGNDHQPLGPEETLQVLIPTAVVAY